MTGHTFYRNRDRFLASVAVALLIGARAEALIVGNEPPPTPVPATTVNPAEYSGWTQGDPGWYNVSASGSNYVYLGDGWVLSARHVGYSSSAGVSLQTILPGGGLGPVETFHRIPGSYYLDYGYDQGTAHQYAVSNPISILSETGQTISLADSVGTHFTDLQLFRINRDPGLPSLSISSGSLPADFTRTNAPEVVAVGSGRSRVAAETHWNVNETTNPWTWTETAGAGTRQGYERDAVAVKRFGTNRLADPHPNFNGDPNDPGATNYSDQFDGVVSDTTAVLELETPDGVTRDVISMMTVFDKSTSPGETDLEFQALSSNSGSGVFYNRSGQWELAGIVHAIFTFSGQPNQTAVYGNTTLISDLSYYNQDYFHSIKDIIESHPDYSIAGDVNLDGMLSGDGTGLPTADDVTAFVAGWGYDNGLDQGTITSWSNGDLNRDGKTDVDDFFRLRSALNGEISEAVLTLLFGSGGVPEPSGGVPEPSACVLAFLAASMVAFGARYRRPRRMP